MFVRKNKESCAKREALTPSTQCHVSTQKALALTSTNLSGTNGNPSNLADVLGSNGDRCGTTGDSAAAQNNTRVREGGNTSAELRSNGGLLTGERHLKSGVTAGETALISGSLNTTNACSVGQRNEKALADQVTPKPQEF